MIAFFYFFILFLLEGVGFVHKKNIVFFTFFIPVIYFFESVFKKKRVFLPRRVSFFYFGFLFFSLIFYPFFGDKIIFVFRFFYYLCGYFIFILGYNERGFLKKNLLKYLSLAGIVFSLGSFYFQKHPPSTALQFVYPSLPNHNHLGDFLGLVLILSGVGFKKYRFFFILLFFYFFYFFLVSFSRSAYLSLIVVLIFYLFLNKKTTKNKLFLGFLIGLSFFFFVFSQKQIYQFSFFIPVKNFFIKYFSFQPRDVLSRRNEYFNQAIKGFLEKPFTGWGMGNFIYVSLKHASQPNDLILSAFNLFLTILTETGLVAFLFFTLFFLQALEKSDQKNIFFYLFLYQTFNFLTDYTYSIYTFFLFWLLLAGINYQKSEKNLPLIVYPLLSYLGLFFTVLYLGERILNLTNQYQLSALVFPWQQLSYQKLILESSFYKPKKTGKLIKKYYHLAPDSNETLNFLGNFYYQTKNYRQSFFYYHQAILKRRFPSPESIAGAYLTKKEIEGEKMAKKYLQTILQSIDKGSDFLKSGLAPFCNKEKIVGCRYAYLYIPKPNSVEKSGVGRYQATYHFNNLGSHNQINYSIKKPKNVFRIIVLGDAHSFGFLVNTKDSWPERLANLLNQKIKQGPSRKIEIINLSYHNYDLLYQVERYLIDGKKLEPDLIIWMNNNFYRLHEYFAPILEKYYSYDQEPTRSEYQKKGVYFPSWHFASEEYYKQINEEEIFQKEKEAIEEFFENYRKPVILVTLEQIPQEIKKTLLSSSQITIYELNEIKDDKNNFYPQIGSLNPQGHQKIAEFLKEVVLNYFK